MGFYAEWFATEVLEFRFFVASSWKFLAVAFGCLLLGLMTLHLLAPRFPTTERRLALCLSTAAIIGTAVAGLKFLPEFGFWGRAGLELYLTYAAGFICRRLDVRKHLQKAN